MERKEGGGGVIEKLSPENGKYADIYRQLWKGKRGGGVIEKLSPENGKYADIYRQLWKGKRGGV